MFPSDQQATTTETGSLIHVIACGVLAPDLRHIAGQFGPRVTLDFLPGGLHERPDELKRRLQETIDRVSTTFRGERIVVGYGVCGLGTVGLQARNVPLAIPRVNDCIALFLGSNAAYREQFARYPGTYYVSAGWIEEKAQPHAAGQDVVHYGGEPINVQELIDRYGPDNAEAIRAFLNSWQRQYQRAAFIDTGVAGQRRRYADLARAMAEEFGWRYEEIPGSHELLTKLLMARQTTDDVLLVAPHHVTVHDPVSKTLDAVPVWETGDRAGHGDHTLVFEGEPAKGRADAPPGIRLGLGIDAGGTYTDVVLYDFNRDRVVDKAKSLTTKWDFTIGIGKALDCLDTTALTEVDLVSISTTLATNAIVEGRGQKVGLLIFPPYGLFEPSDITYRPIGILEGKLEIDGSEIAPVNPEQARKEIRHLLEHEQVGAFAVSGYASHVNPAHELQVKEMIERETALGVSCAHELSEKCNYRIRSVTAALNASIIPCLEALLSDVDQALGQRGILAPRMVVKSDGTLMSLPVARRRPIETILSGPAASVAGACYLAGLDDATVVDMGGTTTDTATIRAGVVRTCAEGALVGGWRTHVEALDLRTQGLGGDSLIARGRDGTLNIGPLRVAPVAWTLSNGHDSDRPLDWLETHWKRFRRSTYGMELIALTHQNGQAELTDEERRVLDVLAQGPCCLDELATRLDTRRWQFLPIDALERRNLVFRSGMTPTDLLHATGRLDLWNVQAAKRFCDFFCRLLGLPCDELSRSVHDLIVRRLATELLKKHLSETVAADGLDHSAAARELLDNWLGGGSNDYRVRISLKQPVVGIGAPVHVYLPEAAGLLETRAIIPRHADVANAVGAITSRVLIQKKIEISPAETGKYIVAGLPKAPAFADFHAAQQYALDQLQTLVRHQGQESGTSDTCVEIQVRDRVAPAADGTCLFLGRSLTARLSGRPDLARLAGRE